MNDHRTLLASANFPNEAIDNWPGRDGAFSQLIRISADKRSLDIDEARSNEAEAKRQCLMAQNHLHDLEKQIAQRETLRAAAPALWSGAANAQTDPSPPPDLTTFYRRIKSCK